MLEYERQIFLDILQDDGLVIAAKGLGLESVVVNLLKVYCDPGNLVFVLGAEGSDQEWMISSLLTQGVTPSPHVVNSEVGVVEREKSYLEGGIWMVPTRILIVDFIKKRIPIDLITGIIVWKAHKILESHQESFVLRLFRQGNKTGFIKAFSNFASSFTQGLLKVETVMKTLFVRNLFLWPRYHAAVKSSLSQYKPNVIELHLEMTSSMVQLQNALLDLIKMTIQELKRLNPSLDTEELTVENSLVKSFHKLLHSQLDPIWHALSERTKILVSDLKLFHHFIISLLSQDCVSFHSQVNVQRKSDRAVKGSGWHFHPSAEILFNTSRQRVFGQTSSETIDPEPNPKWTMLSQVLTEIHQDVSKLKRDEESSRKDIEEQLEEMFGSDTVEQDQQQQKQKTCNDESVLVLVYDRKTCHQLKSYLTMGSTEYLTSQYRKCFGNKKLSNEKQEDSGDGAKKTENEGGEVTNEDEDTTDCESYTLTLTQETMKDLDKTMSLGGCFEVNSTTEKTLGDESVGTPVIIIQSFKKDWITLSKTLSEVAPRFVIMYDSDVTVVRQLEVYQRNHPAIQLTVYFLIYGGTVEEQSYLTSLRKEKEAFDWLINEKARIVLPENFDDLSTLNREVGKSLLGDTDSSRRGGGVDETVVKTTPRVIVDMREFRSELPALIHARGIDIEPLTLTVGDYILTPDICLERKSVSDLIQSLNSGRLYNQALAMTRNYSRPMLLIEFDKDKPFDLQDRYYLSTDSSSEQIITKLQLLTIHFPQLRLVWSPSPHATAQLFEELKQSRPEPDLNTAVSLGVEQIATDEDKFNPGVQNLLSKLPGVTTKNIYNILHRGLSLDHLRTLSLDELNVIVENVDNAQLIYDGIHCKHEPCEGTTTGSSVIGRGRGRGKRKRFH